MYECQNDCIHLRACRRVQQIAKSKYTGLCIPRHCTSECTAYQSKDEIYKKVADAIEWAFAEGQNGMDYINYDINKWTFLDYEEGAD